MTRHGTAGFYRVRRSHSFLKFLNQQAPGAKAAGNLGWRRDRDRLDAERATPPKTLREILPARLVWPAILA
jgi:hypothetical protein